MKRDGDVLQDMALAALCLVGIAACAVLLVHGGGHSAPMPGVLPERPIGRVVVSANEIRRRPHRTLVWESLRDGDSAYSDDTLFVPPGGDASLIFTDGSTLELDENTHNGVEAGAETRVRLQQGALYARDTRSDIAVETPTGTAELQHNGAARVALLGGQTQLDVYAGKAKAAGAEVAAGTRATLTQNGTHALPAFSATLTNPERNFRLYASDPLPVIELQWQGAPSNARVQVATSADFAKPVVDAPALNHHPLQAPRAGIYYWRVVDAKGVAASETRRVTFVADTPPAPLRPATHEIVGALPSAMLAFVWMPAPGAKRYRVELSASRDFETLVADEHSDSSVLYLAKTLDEGTYYWRVRVDPDERPGAPYSAVIAFRLVTRPVLEAPRLLGSEVQVGTEKKPE